MKFRSRILRDFNSLGHMIYHIEWLDNDDIWYRRQIDKKAADLWWEYTLMGSFFACKLTIEYIILK